jgi:hypothetical protein
MPRLRHAALIVVLALIFPGCLTALKTVSAVYEPQTDQFRFLTVYQQIMSAKAADEQADEKWLAALYENRQSLIIVPEDIGFDAWGESAIMPLDASKWVSVPLAQAPGGGLTTFPTEIPTSGITVLPGRFFLRGEGNLCYYHQVIVPGKTADAVFAYISHKMATPGKDSASDLLSQAIDYRSKQSGPISWDDFTKEALAQAIASLQTDQATTGPSAPPAVTQIPFDPQTLQMLRDDLLAGKLTFVRSADHVTFTVRMTPADVSGSINFANTFRAGLEDQLSQQSPNETHETADTHRMIARLLNCAAVNSPDPEHVQFTIDLTALFNSFDDPVETNPPIDKDAVDAARRMAARTGADLGIDQNLTVEQIEEDFKANKLASYLPNPSVPPGTDMGPIGPATQPAPAAAPDSSNSPGL